MPTQRVIVLHEKHGNRVIAHTDEAVLNLIGERLEEGWWYDDWDDGNLAHQWEQRARAIVDDQDASAAWRFLRERKDHEYEGYEETVMG